MMALLKNINFENPAFFLLLLVIPLLIWWKIFKNGNKKGTAFTVSSLEGLHKPFSLRTALVPYLPWLRIFAISAFIIALARPQLTLKEEEVIAEGIDIMLAIDLSTSMLTRDFTPDRLSATKIVASS